MYKSLSRASLFLLALVGAGAVQAQQGPPSPPGAPKTGPQVFNEACVSCHGKDLAGGSAKTLFSDSFLSSHSDAQLRSAIESGPPGVPGHAFKGQFSDNQIWQVMAYLRQQGANLNPKPTYVADPNGQVVKSEKQSFRIEVVTSELETPWALAFLPDGRMLVTERPGRLRIIDKSGHMLPEPVKGTPKVWERQDAGMLDVAPHPDWSRNGWIYLSYVETVPGYVAPAPAAPAPAPGAEAANGARPAAAARTPSPPSMTVLIRGRINARNEWVDTQEIFRAPTALYTGSGSHYGSRFLFDKKGHVFFSLGERGDQNNAQKLTTPLGKIHRVNDDGSVPADNPFVKTPGAIPTIWSYGHRNPEGLAWDPVSGRLWESEHGPTGGDEINIIEKGKNYGWGVASMGIQPGITQTAAPGTEQPVTFYIPTIAPSGIAFYSGAKYPGWKNNLFVAALAGQELLRLEIKDRRIVRQEPLFRQFGRVRAVTTGLDGLLYVLTQDPTGPGTGLSLSASTPGKLLRLVPVSR